MAPMAHGPGALPDEEHRLLAEEQEELEEGVGPLRAVRPPPDRRPQPVRRVVLAKPGRLALASLLALALVVVAVRSAAWLRGGGGGPAREHLDQAPSLEEVAVLESTTTLERPAATEPPPPAPAPSRGQLRHSLGRCLSLPRLEEGLEARLWRCFGRGYTPSQAWKVDAESGSVRNLYGLCMETYQGRLDLWSCNGKRKWSFGAAGVAQPLRTEGQCVQVAGGAVKLGDCGDGFSQDWTVSEPDASGFVQIQGSGGKCLEMVAPHKSGSLLRYGDCQGEQEARTQKWTYESQGSQIRLGDGLCLEAADPDHVATAAKVLACGSAPGQRWHFYESGQVASAAGGRYCLELKPPDGDGAEVRLQVCNELRPEQQWSAAFPPLLPGAAPPSEAAAFAAEPAAPSAQTSAVPATPEPRQDACLCLFDVDRTLTGKQGVSAPQCPGNRALEGVLDTAFQQGPLTLSELGQGLSKTFCGGCFLGIISAGSAGGPDEKRALRAALTGLGELPQHWSGASHITSPLVSGCFDGHKARCAAGVVDWYRRERNVLIAPARVHFFDDHSGNTAGFADRGFNARQISCGSRDMSMNGVVGYCGARLEEIVPQPGIYNCPSS